MAGNISIAARLWLDSRDDIAGKWPIALVELDLEYWGDTKACEGRKRPGPSALARTWGWSKSTVIRFLQARGLILKRTKVDQGDTKVDQGDTKVDQSPEDETVESEAVGPKRTKADQRDTKADQSGPALIETRAVPSPSPSPSPSPENKMSKSDDSDRALVARWQKMANDWHSIKGGPHLQRSKGQGKMLWTRMKKEGADNVGKVLRWYVTSQHERAVMLREKYGLKTLMRESNFEEYLGFAMQPEPTARGEHPDEDNDDWDVEYDPAVHTLRLVEP